jgi:hypothetical protein
VSADDGILALLNAVQNLNVHDGWVDVDEAAKVVRVELPYVVFTAGLGQDADERMGGRPGLRALPFSISYVGESREQARWAAAKSREALSRHRLVVDGRESGLMTLLESSEIYPDPDYTGLGGQRLFSGRDKYVVGV